MQSITQLLPQLLPMIGLMFVAAFTPGPNNIMLAASGANFGFRRTLPHMFGIVAGFALVVILAALVLDTLFAFLPFLRGVFTILALVFILWLAWRIATARGVGGGRGGGAKQSRPQTFLEAAAFQLINPKGLGMASTMVTAFIEPDEAYLPQFLTLLACFSVITWLSVITWAEFGVLIRGLLKNESRLRVFNIVMAVLLVASMLPVFAGLAGI